MTRAQFIAKLLSDLGIESGPLPNAVSGSAREIYEAERERQACVRDPQVTEEEERRLADWLCEEDSIMAVLTALGAVREPGPDRAEEMVEQAYEAYWATLSPDGLGNFTEAIRAALEAAGLDSLLSERDQLRAELNRLREALIAEFEGNPLVLRRLRAVLSKEEQ